MLCNSVGNENQNLFFTKDLLSMVEIGYISHWIQDWREKISRFLRQKFASKLLEESPLEAAHEVRQEKLSCWLPIQCINDQVSDFSYKKEKPVEFEVRLCRKI